MKWFVLIVCLLLAGCGGSYHDQQWLNIQQPLTKQQVMDKMGFCTDHNMSISIWRNSNNQPVIIECEFGNAGG